MPLVRFSNRPTLGLRPSQLRVIAVKKTVVVNQFTQSLGSELLTNGDFETGDPPTGWSLGGATLSSVTDTRTGGSGTKAMQVSRLDNSNPYCQQQPTTVAGKWYEFSGWYRNVDFSSGAYVQWANNPNVDSPINASTTWKKWSNTSRRTATGGFIRGRGGSSTNGQTGRYDDFSVKVVNTNVQAVMPASDGTLTFSFTLPSSPVSGETIHLIYRIPAGGTIEDASASFWDLYLKRNDANNDWDVYLDDVNANTRTNRTSATGVGTPDALRVVLSGTTHTIYTGAGGTFTARGSPVVLDFLTTEKGANTVYSSTFTPNALVLAAA